MKFIIIDVQGFKSSETEFTPKELAAFDGTKYSHFIFNPPFPFNDLQGHLKKTNSWLIRNYHCLNWEEGFTSLEHLQVILQRLTCNVNIILVKGLEKVKFLKNFINLPVIDLGNQTNPIQPRKPLCFFHTSEICVCALSNVFCLHKALSEN